MPEPLLQMRGIVKQFPGVRALDGVDLDVRAGEVHCLLGQNGAGKSTLIKVLAGAHQPDAGRISWRGEPVRLTDPQAAMSIGIATIYQELDLVAGLTVADNVFLGREHARLGVTRPSSANRAAARLLERLGHADIRPTAEVGSLPAAAQQMVSIARALSQDAKLIIMDEPSAVLDSEEVERLFTVIRDLTAHDVAVVYISHRLEEIREVGDRITVLKDGRTVATGLPARETATREVITLMTGRDIEYVFPERREHPDPDAAPLLEVEGLGLRGSFADVSFTVRPGEVVGLAGLVGSCRWGSRSPATSASRAWPGSPAAASSPGPPRPRPPGSRSPHSRSGPPTSTGRSGRCRAATSRRWCWPGGCCGTAGCCCSTSRPAAWTSAPGRRCTHSSANWPTAAWPSSWSPARSPRCSAWPTGSWSSVTAACWRRNRPARSTSTGCSTWSWRTRPTAPHTHSAKGTWHEQHDRGDGDGRSPAALRHGGTPQRAGVPRRPRGPQPRPRRRPGGALHRRHPH